MLVGPQRPSCFASGVKVVPHNHAEVVRTGREGGIVPPNPPCWLEKLYDWWLVLTLKIRGYYAANIYHLDTQTYALHT